MKLGVLFCGILVVMIGIHNCDEVADNDSVSDVSDTSQTEVTITIAKKLKSTLESWRDDCGREHQEQYNRIDFVIKILMKVIKKHEEYKASGDRAHFGEHLDELQPYFRDVCNTMDSILSDSSIPFWSKYHDRTSSLFKPLKNYYSHFNNSSDIGNIVDDSTSSIETPTDVSSIEQPKFDETDDTTTDFPAISTTKVATNSINDEYPDNYLNKPTHDDDYYQQPTNKPYYRQQYDDGYQQPRANRYYQQSLDDDYYQPSRSYRYDPPYNRGEYNRPSDRWSYDRPSYGRPQYRDSRYGKYY